MRTGQSVPKRFALKSVKVDGLERRFVVKRPLGMRHRTAARRSCEFGLQFRSTARNAHRFELNSSTSIHCAGPASRTALASLQQQGRGYRSSPRHLRPFGSAVTRLKVRSPNPFFGQQTCAFVPRPIRRRAVIIAIRQLRQHRAILVMTLTEPEKKSALIDRRVRIIHGRGEGTEVLVSSLRNRHCYVLLGEPGSGKSTVLAQEASHIGIDSVTVRYFLNNLPTQPGAFVCLDALDEYRTEGSASDRLYNLANAMAGASVSRWRITCRAEDWRLDADLAALSGLSGDEPICVVELLPLNTEETLALLKYFGCEFPQQFLDKAEHMGALGFVENPFSLWLLFSATIKDGGWPKTRFALYNTSISRLLRERDSFRKGKSRSSLEEIGQAAGRLNLFVLVTGAQSIWMSNQSPPDVDRGRYLDVEDLGLKQSVVEDVLDTALFRGDGETFAPMHRTVAEFSAAQYLGEVLTGGDGSASLPLSRILAVLGGFDGAPPSELRGLYGWLATQLAERGRHDDVKKMISADPVTALHYGDPASYAANEKRHLLELLPSHRPHHGWPDGISLGGLASEDMVTDFEAILLSPDSSPELLQTLVDVLQRGSPLIGLHGAFENIILDAKRPGRLRNRVFDLNLQLAAIDPRIRTRYYDALQSEIATEDRVALQIRIAQRIPEELTADKLKVLLCEFQALPATGIGWQLMPLDSNWNNRLAVELLTEPVTNWLPEGGHFSRSDEVNRAIDALLSTIILSDTEHAAEQVWRCAQNSRRSENAPYGQNTMVAILHRYRNNAAWYAALLGVAFEMGAPHHEQALNDYQALTGGADAEVREAAWALFMENPDRKHLLAGIVYSVSMDQAPVERKRRVDYLDSLPEQRLLAILSILRAEAVDVETKAPAVAIVPAAQHADRLNDMLAGCDDYRLGKRSNDVTWAANVYVNGDHSLSPENRLMAAVANSQVRDAFVSGFKHLADNFAMDAKTLHNELVSGRIDLALFAGIFASLDDNDRAFAPDVSLPLLVFVSGAAAVHDYAQQLRLLRWAMRQLSSNAPLATQRLAEYWALHIADSESYLPGLRRVGVDQTGAAVLGDALIALLSGNQQVRPNQLANALRALGMCMPTTAIIALVQSALPHAANDEIRLIWQLAQMSLNPVAHAIEMLKTDQSIGSLRYLDESDLIGFGPRLIPNDQQASCYFHTYVVCSAGPSYPPPALGKPETNGERNFAVRNSLRVLAENPSEAAGTALKRFSVDAALGEWHAEILLAIEVQAAKRRDDDFAFAQPSKLAAVLKNGPPLNSSDLFAVLTTELRRFQEEFRTDDLSPWTQFWNFDGETRTTPRHENMCRDYVLGRLRDRLERYMVTAALAEAQHAGNTRADMLVICGAKARVPVEVKRHMDQHVWTAAGTQLKHYSDHLAAGGRGVYVVLWFGLAAGKLPGRPGKKPNPTTPSQLQDYLVEDLPADLRPTTEVLVFDVSPLVTKHGAKKKKGSAGSSPP